VLTLFGGAMIGFLRDPIWQFIGASLGLLAIILSVYLFIQQRKKKSLSYDVLTLTPLLTVNEELTGKIRIVYEGTAVQNVYLLILKVQNDGNVPITPSDFVAPLRFQFRKDLQMLSAEVIETTPDSLDPKIRVNTSGFTLSPLLLNNEDTFILKLLLAHPGSGLGLHVRTRIVGVSEVKLKQYVYLPFWLAGGLLILAGVVGTLFMSTRIPVGMARDMTIFQTLQSDAESVTTVLGLLGAMLVVGIGFIVMYIPVIRDYRQKASVKSYILRKAPDD
jgi:hypothetical protein